MPLMNRCRSLRLGAVLALFGALSIGTSWAAVPKEKATPLDQKEFFKPDLYISTQNLALRDALPQLANRAAWEAFLLRGANAQVEAFIDPRSGTATNIIVSVPLIPGSGVGNHVGLGDLSRRLGRTVSSVDEEAVGQAVLQYVKAHSDLLGIDSDQLGPVRARVSNPDLWHVSIPQVFKGVPVRHGRIVAAISHGNLILIGTESWGNVSVSIDASPGIGADEAVAAGFDFADGRAIGDQVLGQPTLEIVPFAPPEYQHGEGFAGPIGAGFGHRLVWTFRFQRPPDSSDWEVLVDARTAEVISFQDKNQYVSKQATGGVYPLTNTEVCPTPQTCGTMQLNWPMPWANTGLAAPNNFTNSAGVFDYTSGTATSTLNGQFVRIADVCGAISLSSATGDLAFGGANGQHDCVTPGSGGAGNTASSRSCFYEVNKIKEQARGWLPANTWLNQVLVSNVNILQTCNANYQPGAGTINFFRSGGGCRNTGEIAAVFDHEWGHAMDDNDTGGALSNSSEGYADIAAIYRLQASCVGHGFWWTNNRGCGMTADGTGFNAQEAQQGPSHCATDCSGVRDSDWAKHNPNTPDTALGYVCTNCGGTGGPCNRQVHCAAAPSRQAAWDLVARDLVGPPFNMSSQTAFIVGNKLFYQGSGNVGLWHACSCGVTSDGCAATNAYMQWIGADDDDGNLGNGTPHLTAIHAAFNRHGIACATPTPQNSGCALHTSTAATLGATPGNNSVSLSWTAVTGATRYWVFRTEGHAGCDFGKALIATVNAPGTTFTDTQVANGRPYSYNVVAAGASSACFGPASNCATATPTAIADFSVSCSPSSLTVLAGGSAPTICTVQSTQGFSALVNLSCNNLPAGVTCGFSPGSVTPPANGAATTTLTVSVAGSVAAGTYNFQARGTSGALVRDGNIALTVNVQAVAPAALSVDAGGNGIFEPGETVAVSPSWQNQGTVALALTGALTNFTGPAGPTYTIDDGAASYGTINTGATAPCGADCYGLTVTGARPQPHWDTTALETVTPTGSTKTWTLHIGDSFTDVAAGPFERFIETIFHEGVTGGCDAARYCPLNPTSREQMAVFVLVAREGAGYNPPACTTPIFNDVPASSPFCKFIEELSRRGVTTGCAAGQYCPQSNVTREQMAVFVLLTLDPTMNPPACTTPVFQDVPANDPFCRWIEELVRRQVVTGCAANLYCPDNPVTREQMSVFLSVTFGLTLYGL